MDEQQIKDEVLSSVNRLNYVQSGLLEVGSDNWLNVKRKSNDAEI